MGKLSSGGKEGSAVKVRVATPGCAGLSKTSRFGDSHGSRILQKPRLSPKRLASNREFLTDQGCAEAFKEARKIVM